MDKDGMFPFPSNGKAHLDSQAEAYEQSTTESEFPFPSNGKAHLDERGLSRWDSRYEIVSIPFKREGTFRLCFWFRGTWR